MKKIIKNFSLTIASNFLTLAISTIVILVVPKLIGVREYGLWQLFIFYSSYVGLLHFGWIDGIYLRYGGKKYKELDKGLMKGQFKLLTISQLLFMLIVGALSVYFYKGDLRIVFFYVSFSIIIINLKTFFQFILQMTNRISEFATSNFLSSLIYIFTLVLFIAIGFRNFFVFILSYLLGQLFSLIYCLFICRDILTVNPNKNCLHNIFIEVHKNIIVGSKLVISNITGMLIVGVVRFGIQNEWDIATFGKISLVMSISNLLMVFIGAISLVLFPILRQMNESMIDRFYSTIGDILMPILFLGMFIYFPIVVIIPKWLPEYETALSYLAILFPMVVYQAKFELLSNTFLKVLRMEKQLMFINIFTVAISILLTGITAFVLHNLSLTVLVIVIVMAIRGIISDFYLGSKLRIKFLGSLVLDVSMVVIFTSSNWFFPLPVSILLYSITYVVYLLIEMSNIKNAIKFFNLKRVNM
ncbi:hypothetical protein AB0X56_06435 [Weissella paramesenteroides]|uniref:hypothetical protein n=1 Tax=Weissella paramesenteroides TaxID=1249 RepID=UPI003F265C16